MPPSFGSVRGVARAAQLRVMTMEDQAHGGLHLSGKALELRRAWEDRGSHGLCGIVGELEAGGHSSSAHADGRIAALAESDAGDGDRFNRPHRDGSPLAKRR